MEDYSTQCAQLYNKAMRASIVAKVFHAAANLTQPFYLAPSVFEKIDNERLPFFSDLPTFTQIIQKNSLGVVNENIASLSHYQANNIRSLLATCQDSNGFNSHLVDVQLLFEVYSRTATNKYNHSLTQLQQSSEQLAGLTQNAKDVKLAIHYQKASQYINKKAEFHGNNYDDVTAQGNIFITQLEQYIQKSKEIYTEKMLKLMSERAKNTSISTSQRTAFRELLTIFERQQHFYRFLLCGYEDYFNITTEHPQYHRLEKLENSLLQLASYYACPAKIVKSSIQDQKTIIEAFEYEAKAIIDDLSGYLSHTNRIIELLSGSLTQEEKDEICNGVNTIRERCYALEYCHDLSKHCNVTTSQELSLLRDKMQAFITVADIIKTLPTQDPTEPKTHGDQFSSNTVLLLHHDLQKQLTQELYNYAKLQNIATEGLEKAKNIDKKYENIFTLLSIHIDQKKQKTLSLLEEIENKAKQIKISSKNLVEVIEKKVENEHKRKTELTKHYHEINPETIINGTLTLVESTFIPTIYELSSAIKKLSKHNIKSSTREINIHKTKLKNLYKNHLFSLCNIYSGYLTKVVKVINYSKQDPSNTDYSTIDQLIVDFFLLQSFLQRKPAIIKQLTPYNSTLHTRELIHSLTEITEQQIEDAKLIIFGIYISFTENQIHNTASQSLQKNELFSNFQLALTNEYQQPSASDKKTQLEAITTFHDITQVLCAYTTQEGSITTSKGVKLAHTLQRLKDQLSLEMSLHKNLSELKTLKINKENQTKISDLCSTMENTQTECYALYSNFIEENDFLPEKLVTLLKTIPQDQEKIFQTLKSILGTDPSDNHYNPILCKLQSLSDCSDILEAIVLDLHLRATELFEENVASKKEFATFFNSGNAFTIKNDLSPSLEKHTEHLIALKVFLDNIVNISTIIDNRQDNEDFSNRLLSLIAPLKQKAITLIKISQQHLISCYEKFTKIVFASINDEPKPDRKQLQNQFAALALSIYHYDTFLNQLYQLENYRYSVSEPLALIYKISAKQSINSCSKLAFVYIHLAERNLTACFRLNQSHLNIFSQLILVLANASNGITSDTKRAEECQQLNFDLNRKIEIFEGDIAAIQAMCQSTVTLKPLVIQKAKTLFTVQSQAIHRIGELRPIFVGLLEAHEENPLQSLPAEERNQLSGKIKNIYLSLANTCQSYQRYESQLKALLNKPVDSNNSEQDLTKKYNHCLVLNKNFGMLLPQCKEIETQLTNQLNQIESILQLQTNMQAEKSVISKADESTKRIKRDNHTLLDSEFLVLMKDIFVTIQQNLTDFKKHISDLQSQSETLANDYLTTLLSLNNTTVGCV